MRTFGHGDVRMLFGQALSHVGESCMSLKGVCWLRAHSPAQAALNTVHSLVPA